MNETENEIPKLVTDFWAHKNPGILMNECRFLNDDYKDSDKWGEVAVYRCKGEGIEKTLFIALTAYQGSLTARELTSDEVNFLLHGTVPE